MNIEKAQLLANQFSSFQFRVFKTSPSVKKGYNQKKTSGNGEVFWQYREYTSDDTIQEIDWKRSGRGDRLIVREREKEGTQDIWLWRSTSPSMKFYSGITSARKEELTELIILALGIIFINSGGSISFLGSSRLPKKGKNGLNNLTESLGTQNPHSEIPYEAGISQHCELIILSDFLASPEQYEVTVKKIAQNGCRGVFVQILDPAEETFPFNGKITFKDMEGFQSRSVHRAEEIREGYLAQLAIHRRNLIKTLDSIGWRFLNFTTETGAEEILHTILKQLILSRNLAR